MKILFTLILASFLCSCSTTQKEELRADGKRIVKTSKNILVDAVDNYLNSLFNK